MAIVTLPDHCWIVANPDGAPFDPDGDGFAHYQVEQHARDAAENLSEAYGPLGAVELPDPCIEVTCDAGCPEPKFEDHDTYGIVHFPDIDIALTMMRGEDWVVGFNHAAWHGHCAPVRYGVA
jgi:hypothetical protein